MKLSLKSLKNLTDNYHKADYKSGGNYQTSYYKFLEEGGTRPPEVRITHLPLTCEYILSTTSIPFTIDIRTHNKIVGDVEVVTTLGESSHTSYQLSNESYTFTFNANSIDVADRRGIEITFTGLNKFEEIVTYSVNVPYERETDCYSLACESNSNVVTFKVDSKSVYAFSVNGRTYQVNSLSELQRIAEDNDLKVSFYRKPLEWGSWNVNSEVTINELGVAKYTGYKTNTEAYYDSFADFDLTDAVTNSLQDPDMQQWQAFNDAVNQLSGVSNWLLDAANSRISYDAVRTDTQATSVDQYFYTCSLVGFNACYGSKKFNSMMAIGSAMAVDDWTTVNQCFMTSESFGYCVGPSGRHFTFQKILNPDYDPNAKLPQEYISFSDIAQQIISNTQSADQGTALFAEAYVEAIAKSVFAVDESKQLVKLSNILEQFEQNKVLRG